MPENAGRKFGKGELYQHNVLNLVKALLRLAKGDLTLDDSQLKAAVQVVWVAQNKLQVTGEYKKTTKTGERVFEGTTKQDLWQLVEKTVTPLQLPQRQRDDSSTSAATRQADVVQNALYYLEDLGVLQDERPKNKRNTRYWIFTLTLKHKDASIEDNLRVVEQKLQVETGQTSPETSSPTEKSIDWHNICLAMLEKQKRLTTNELLSADEDMKFELDDIHVPLALVQRTKPDKRSKDVSPEEGSRLLQPTYEEKQRFKHEEFLAQVLQEGKGQSKGRRIAVIGEPGAGKTTLLQSIAFWLFEDKNQNLGLPIWISLADLEGKMLEEYLLQRWLKKALEVARVTPEQENALVELFKKERVWLFLDGVDEIAGSSLGANHELPLQMVASQLEGWVAKARVVLSCRLNVWEANINALGDDFEKYRLLDFDYPLQVKEFICRWFRKTDADKGEQLWTELDKSERQRIQDLVKNPLRLALLCSTWHSSDKGLPSTKAGLYERFVEVFYTWKKNRFPTTPKQRQELNAALAGLALGAIDSEESRFRLRHKVVCEVLGDPEQENSLFGLALQLGWLNKVGLAAESETQEKVYAFYHPTFQEYFAALAIADWDFFLPRAHDNHNPKPVSERYRIFEPQWKEVILLWLGREEVNREEFIEALVEFEDGCGEFYRYRAYFLAAAGIAEFGDCERADEIVRQLVQWSFGYSDTKKQQGMILVELMEKGARAALQESERTKAVTAIVELVLNSQDKLSCCHAAEFLGKIDKLNLVAINTLVKLINLNRYYDNNHEYDEIRIQAIKSLGEIRTYSPIIIDVLVSIVQKSWRVCHENFCIEAIISLGKLCTSNRRVVDTLVNLIRNPKVDCNERSRQQAVFSLGLIGRYNPVAGEALVEFVQKPPCINTFIVAALSLGKIDNLNFIAVDALIKVIHNSRDDNNCRLAANVLWKISASNSLAIEALIKLIRNSQYEDTCYQAAFALGKIDQFNPIAIDALVKLIQNSQVDFFRIEAAACLGLIDKANPIAVSALVQVIQNTDNELLHRQAASALGEISTSNPTAIKSLAQLIRNSQEEATRWQAANSLGKIDKSNPIAVNALIELIQSSQSKYTRKQGVDSLKNMLGENQMPGVVIALKEYLSDETNEIDFKQLEDCYEVIWHCTQNMTYPAFYQAWHQQEGVGKITTSNSQSLNQADLPQSLQGAIANDSQLSQTIHLICIDGSQFIERDRPAAEIYDQMLDQNCPECNPVPETMPALKLYWNSLKRNSDKRPVLVFYASSTEPYSEAFLTDLSKFKGEICVVTSPPAPPLQGEGSKMPSEESKSSSGSPSSLQGEGVRGWGSLQLFAPSQAIADVMKWIREKVVEE